MLVEVDTSLGADKADILSRVRALADRCCPARGQRGVTRLVEFVGHYPLTVAWTTAVACAAIIAAAARGLNLRSADGLA